MFQRIIDVIKIDIEYTEWDALEGALKSNALKNVKQIAMEFHVWIDEVQSYVRFHRILMALQNAGFEKWDIREKSGMVIKACLDKKNDKSAEYHYQADFAFINTNFLTRISCNCSSHI